VRCPECDSANVYDLTDRGTVEMALDATQSEQSKTSDGEHLADAFVADWRGRAFVAFCLFTVAFVLLGSTRALAPEWTLIAAAIVAAMLTAMLSLGRKGPRVPRAASRKPHGVKILSPARNEPDIVDTANRTVIRGIVRASKTIRSPLEGSECVAFCLAGDGVSDAAFTRFEIDVDGGGRAVVEGEDASVEIPTGMHTLHSATPQLREFLRTRFVFRNPESLPLVEALLRDGDEVEIEGTWTPAPQPELYRDVEWVKVFREEPGSPLIIRR
jgi:hypothetical protein